MKTVYFDNNATTKVAEEVLERRPSALNDVVKDLGKSAESEDAALRGDTADLLGQIGHPSGALFLEKLLQDPNPDVVEIAEEALAHVAP